jgi:hypothetical protein
VAPLFVENQASDHLDQGSTLSNVHRDAINPTCTNFSADTKLIIQASDIYQEGLGGNRTFTKSEE